MCHCDYLYFLFSFKQGAIPRNVTTMELTGVSAYVLYDIVYYIYPLLLISYTDAGRCLVASTMSIRASQ